MCVCVRVCVCVCACTRACLFVCFEAVFNLRVSGISIEENEKRENSITKNSTKCANGDQEAANLSSDLPI